VRILNSYCNRIIILLFFLY